MTSKWLAGACVTVLLAVGGCATIQAPHRENLASGNDELRVCARWFTTLDKIVNDAGVADISARRVEGFPYLRVDRFTASLSEDAAADRQIFNAWIAHMRALDEDGRAVEIANLPVAALADLDVKQRSQARSRSNECASRLATADLFDARKATALLQQQARVRDDYSALKRALGFYALLRIPFAGGIDDWHDEAVDTFRKARGGEPAEHPLTRYVPPGADRYSRAEVAQLLARNSNAIGVLDLSDLELERLFATYAPVFEIETTGEYDRIGRLHWTGTSAPEVDTSQPTVYRKLAYTRFDGRTLVQLVYVGWLPERPKDGAFDTLGGHLDGIVWRVTLAPDGEPVLFDTIHPCGCFHMFFPTPSVEPVPKPGKYMEWAFSPANLPRVGEQKQILVSAQTGTHYLRNVWPIEHAEGTAYHYADYDDLRMLDLPRGGTRSAFGPDGIVPGTERGERFVFWPMGIASAGAMRQWGTHATAFLGRRHFDDADLIERRFRFVE